MDEKLRCGIPEIDAQHEELHSLVVSVQELIADKSKRHLLHPALRQLNQQLVTHFEYEESLLAMVSDEELARHKRTHKGLLSVFNDFFARPQATTEYDYFGRVVSEKVIAHVMEHDFQMMDRVKEYLANRRCIADSGSNP